MRAPKALKCNKNVFSHSLSLLVVINNEASYTYPHPTIFFFALGLTLNTGLGPWKILNCLWVQWLALASMPV